MSNGAPAPGIGIPPTEPNGLALYSIIVLGLTVALLCAVLNQGIADQPWVRALCAFGNEYLPDVALITALPTASSTAFVFTVQWFFLPLYIFVLFGTYWPFSAIRRNNAKKNYAKRSASLGTAILVTLFVLAGTLSFLGDIHLIKFPTLLNNGIFGDLDVARGFNSLTRNIFTSPIFCWFFVFVCAVGYWMLCLTIVMIWPMWKSVFAKSWRGD